MEQFQSIGDDIYPVYYVVFKYSRLWKTLVEKHPDIIDMHQYYQKNKLINKDISPMIKRIFDEIFDNPIRESYQLLSEEEINYILNSKEQLILLANMARIDNYSFRKLKHLLKQFSKNSEQKISVIPEELVRLAFEYLAGNFKPPKKKLAGYLNDNERFPISHVAIAVIAIKVLFGISPTKNQATEAMSGCDHVAEYTQTSYDVIRKIWYIDGRAELFNENLFAQSLRIAPFSDEDAVKILNTSYDKFITPK